MEEGVGRRTPWLWGVTGAALIVVLVVVALSRDPVQFDPDTPEATVQTYLQAISDADYALALEMIDPQDVEDCTPVDLARSSPDEPFTAHLGESREGGADTAVITVRIRFGADAPLDTPSEFTETFTLAQRDGMWLMTGEPWPYFSFGCREEP